MWNRRTLRVAVLVAAVLSVPWAVWLGLQYRELREAFVNRKDYVPTRIYSDVTKIVAPLPRSRIQARMRALGYEWVPGEAEISFKLRDLDYPRALLPPTAPTLSLAGALIHLKFEGPGDSSPLKTIETPSGEIPELYLEPELVATLSRRDASDKANQIRDYVPMDDIPSGIWQAIMSVEDQHFLDHKGLDPRGFARAIWVDLRTLSMAQGGSTLTQQLVKNLLVRRNKNVLKKFNELFLALLLEMEFDKKRILERYLNEVYLGQIGNLEIHGVAEGAGYFFGKTLKQLNLGEIAMMAAVIRGPWYYSPYRNLDRAIARQRLVLDKMVETGQIAEEEAVKAKSAPIRLAPPPKSSNKAPYYADYVKAQLIDRFAGRLSESEVTNAGFKVYTAMDADMNVEAQTDVAEGVARLRAYHKLPPELPLEGALASVEQDTGFIRALVGGTSYATTSFNRILNMKRQVGSTFKPVVYLSAILARRDAKGAPYGPAYPIEDAPWNLVYDNGKQNWSPHNYEEEYSGWIPLRTALANSVNVAAAKIGMQVGLPKIVEAARALGITSDLPQVPALTLGVAELSPVELLQAYSILAARGVRRDLTVIRYITQNDGTFAGEFTARSQPVVDEPSVDLLVEMMHEVFLTGTAKIAPALGFDRPASGKTGTTSDHRDAWFAGFTPQLTTVVWVGLDKDPTAPADPLATDSKSAERDRERPVAVKLTGAGSALPIWAAFMSHTLKGLPAAPFPPSPHLQDLKVDLHSGFPAASGCPDAQTKTDKYLTQEDFGASLGENKCEAAYPESPAQTVVGGN
ncbi:MAG TPA: transglycosylase domain-containing protein [Bdellovibrionota bacterium]|nr:transglycosylase domain-containing protein [Bdellovibrionota bacterium]